MDFIKNNYKKIIKYIFLFCIFLIWNLIIQGVNTDEIWNFGFSYGIFKGEVPYRDFNMVITPFFPFLMSLPFHIFGLNMLVYHIENALLLTILSGLLFKLLEDKAWFILLFFFFPLSMIYPSYNLFLFFLFVILILLEKEQSNDYLIGFVLGILFLTKQSVGFCMILPSLYYIKNKDKIKKRLISFSLVIVLFIVYLIATNSYMQFLDLCVLGLFDFASSNGQMSDLFFVLTMIIIIITLYLIKKDYKNINKYYALAFYSIAIPLFDLYHFQMSFIAFLFMLLYDYKVDIKIRPALLTIGVIIFISIVNVYNMYHNQVINYPNNLKYFNYRLINKTPVDFSNEITKFIKDNKDREVIILDYNAYYLKMVSDMPLGYLDLVNMGNWGYNGSEKLLNAVKKKKDAIFLVNKGDLVNHQTDKKTLKYVIKNGKKIDSIYFYDVYVFD